MRVLVACEFSGVVREAFRAKGHDAWSCDIIPSRDESKYHIQGDALEQLELGWDLLIAHPPCTYLCVSGNRWMYDPRYPNRAQDREAAAAFFMAFIHAPIEKIAVENPIGIMNTRFRKPDQIIQPWQFGHAASKATCLWLKNLPLLKPTQIVESDLRMYGNGKRMSQWYSSRKRERSITFPGIAAAMADQWTT